MNEDAYIPQQIWWALEAQIQRDPGAVVELLSETTLWGEAVFESTLAERIGRRFMAERSEMNLETCAQLLQAAPSAAAAKLLVRGMEKALQGSEIDALPESLELALTRLWENFPLDADLVGFAVRLGSEEGRQAARRFVMDVRQDLGDAETLPLLMTLLKDDAAPESLRLVALTGMRRYTENAIANELVRELPSLSGDLANTAQSVLTGRLSWSMRLLEAVDRGELSREVVRYNSLLVMQRREDPLTQQLIKKHWGTLRQPEEAKVQKIEDVRAALANGKGDAANGKALFEVSCGICHQLFDSGKSVGPELTGYERDNLEFLLPAIIDPSLALREEFELVSVTLRRKAGDSESTVLTGFISAVGANSVTLKDLVGNESVIAKRDIAGQERSRLSAMPEGLLDAMTSQQIRDLFAFIQQ